MNGKPISKAEALAIIRAVAARTDPSFREA